MADDLSDLRGIFDQLQRKRLGEKFVGRCSPERILDHWAGNADYPDWQEWAESRGEDRHLFIKMVKAAKVYVIARDEGRDAALLWKLRNG